MPNISGSLTTFMDTPSSISAMMVTTKTRPHGTGLMVSETLPVPIPSTKIVSFFAVPGPILITLIIGGEEEQHRGIVPEGSTATLADVVSADHDWTPEQLTAFQQLTAQAKAAAQAAEADRIQTGKDRVQTGLDRQAAAGSATLAGTRANAAEGHAQATAADRTQTGLDRTAASQSAQGAHASEQAAAQHLAEIEPLAQGVADAVPVVTEAASTAVSAAGTATEQAGIAEDAAARATLIADPGGALAAKADLVGGVIPTSQIPAVALTKPHQVPNRAALLALTDVQEGDVAVITEGPDQGTYMLGDGPSTVWESWVPLATSPDAPVQSVNGQVGTVVLGAGDVGAAPVSHRHPWGEIDDGPGAVHVINALEGLNGLDAQIGDLIILTIQAAGVVVMSFMEVTSPPVSEASGYTTISALSLSPLGHSHSRSQITDLPTISRNATNDALVQRTTVGQIALPTATPSANEAVRRDWVEARGPKILKVTSLPTNRDPNTLYVVVP